MKSQETAATGLPSWYTARHGLLLLLPLLLLEILP